tara:strand:+ start:4195 stop:5058 length:864 start_codon:yes stop_codon:yes gene_type:complete
MCGGGGGDQTVTQKTEMDPFLRRQLYGGTAANPRGGFGGNARANSAQSAQQGANLVQGGPGEPSFGYGGEASTGPSDNSSSGGFFSGGGADSYGSFGSVGDALGGIGDAIGVSDYSGAAAEANNMATGGLVQGYNMGGQVQPQGLAALNQGQMPTMNGQMPNLSDPMTAASLAMAVRSPEMRYGSIMAQSNPNPMMAQSNPMLSNPMMSRPMMSQPMQGYAMGGYIEGPGTGTSDSIPATIYQNGGPVQEARLSDGEFVMTKAAVDGAGGAAQMYRMMHGLEKKGTA